MALASRRRSRKARIRPRNHQRQLGGPYTSAVSASAGLQQFRTRLSRRPLLGNSPGAYRRPQRNGRILVVPSAGSDRPRERRDGHNPQGQRRPKGTSADRTPRRKGLDRASGPVQGKSDRHIHQSACRRTAHASEFMDKCRRMVDRRLHACRKLSRRHRPGRLQRDVYRPRQLAKA